MRERKLEERKRVKDMHWLDSRGLAVVELERCYLDREAWEQDRRNGHVWRKIATTAEVTARE